MDVGLLAACVGGMLALISPCAALLLPAFFASTVGTGPRLWLHGLIFYLGLITLLVPMGMGVSAVGHLLVEYRSIVIAVASIIMIALGIMQLLGVGFDLSRALPGSDAMTNQAQRATGLAKSYLLGVTSGLAGFCAGPILGAVLTISIARGDVVAGALLMASYALGMVLPLLAFAMVWTRFGTSLRGFLHGREITIFGRRTNTTSVITGLLITAVGILFWVTNGLVDLPQIIPDAWAYDLQSNLGWLSNPVVEIVAIVLVAAIVLAVWVRHRSRNHNKQV